MGSKCITINIFSTVGAVESGTPGCFGSAFRRARGVSNANVVLAVWKKVAECNNNICLAESVKCGVRYVCVYVRAMYIWEPLH